MIRKSLIKRIQWEALGMCCAGEAENGRQACEQIDRLRPDIVITDIKMPRADGFFAIRKARKSHPGLQFIVISGHDDFLYLKQSVQLQVLNYILKPIGTEELHETLRHAAEKIAQYREASSVQDTAHHYKALYHREKLENVFAQLLFSRMDHAAFKRLLQELSYPLDMPRCQVLLLNLPSDQTGDAPLSVELRRAAEQAVERLCYPAKCLLLPVSRHVCAAVLNEPAEAELSPFLLSGVYDAVCRLAPELRGRLYLSCGGPIPVKSLFGAYYDALLQMLRRFLQDTGETRIFAPSEQTAAEQATGSFQSEFTVAFHLQMYEECKHILHRAMEKAVRQPETFVSALQRVMGTVNTCVTQQTGQPIFLRNAQELYLLQFASRKHFLQAVCGLLDSCKRSDATPDIGEQIVSYLYEHYTQPLTVQSLSELFHVNQIYLGQLIKKKTGRPFNALINSLRVDLAAQSMREHPDIPLKELAFSLGFVDAHYFTKVFKQHLGVTPSEYREKAKDRQ